MNQNESLFDYLTEYYKTDQWDKELLEYRLKKREKELNDLRISEKELIFEIKVIKEALKKYE